MNAMIEGTEVVLENKPLWWHLQGLSQTASGYGKKITTHWMVQYMGKLRRVYCTIFSNAGTCWITVKGKKIVVC